MGMYTELVAAFRLPHLYDPELSILKYILHETYEMPDKEFLQHPLFKTRRWGSMLGSDSYYFDGQTYSILKYDLISKCHYLTVRFNVKNYDGEIENFLDWMYPISSNRGFIGYKRHEEFDNPTLIYFDDSGVEYC